MLKKNNFFTGVLLGAVAPLIAFLFAEYTSLGDRFADKPLTLYALAGVVNLLLVRYYYKLHAPKTGGSIIALTFVGLLILLFKKEIVI